MDRVRSIALSSGFMTHTGPLDFLDYQTSFDASLGNDLAMLRLTNYSKGQYATEDTDYLRSTFHTFCNLCRLHIFFVIPSNLSMLVRRSMNHRKYLRTFLLSFPNPQ